MLADESTDVDELREELKFELIVLHTEMKELNQSWDFTPIINSLLADQGPALTLVPRIKKQIERLKKLEEDFKHKSRDIQRPPAALAQSFSVAAIPKTTEGKPGRRRRLPRSPDIVVEIALPSWGECKRYSNSLDQSQ
jgi:hypothetical protein